MREVERRLLLLNTTNHPVRIAYPYAFVQVSAAARSHGIATRRVDLFGISTAQRATVLRNHIERFRPDLIGVTLRNTDSLLSADYMKRQDDRRFTQPFQRNLLEQLTQGAPPYFPTHDTRDLIWLLRTLSTTPIVVGGFGFSVQPEPLMHFLRPDFGVVGDAAPLLARFDDLMARRGLDTIANLYYFDVGALRKNPRVFVGPSPEREYVDEIILDRNQLLGSTSANLPATSRAIPVEVMRGCPMLCTFCAEPNVKGNRVQFRNLDVIAAELDFLRHHGLYLAWFVCSEINAMGNDFALQLAERLISINEQRPTPERIRWFTYYLLRFSRDELKLLRRSGFLGGWNDIPAFEDSNLKQLRVPYRRRHLVQSLKDMIAIRKDEAPEAPSLAHKIFYDPDHRGTTLPDDMFTSPVLTLFLGNRSTTAKTVRETLETMDSEGLAEHFDAAFVVRSERVFEYNHVARGSSDAVRSFSPAATSPAQTSSVDPTFCFPKALVEQLGSVEELEPFFIYIEDTFFSRNHLFRKDWSWFLGTTLSAVELHALWLDVLERGVDATLFTEIAPAKELLLYLSECPSPEKTNLLMAPAPGRKALVNAAADAVIRAILTSNPEPASRVLDHLRIPHDALGEVRESEFRLTVRLYSMFESNAALIDDTQRALSIALGSREWLALSDLCYRHNLRLQPAYRVFFVEEKSAHTRTTSAMACLL